MYKVGFIGVGNMAEALIRGLTGSKVLGKKDITASDISKSRENHISKKYGVKISKSNNALAKESEVVVLSVKPNNIKSVVMKIASDLTAAKILISIAAGVTTEVISKALGKRGKIVRVMPNTPALVLEGASAIYFGRGITAKDKKQVEKIFGAIGKTFTVEKEELMNGITALSGSGPAFVSLFIEALSDGGVKTGLTRATALELAVQTVLGTAKLISEENIHPVALKDMVSSPAGTTIEGLTELEVNGFRGNVISAIEAAEHRSRELSEEAE
ncbi:MAG: pyrroline-5-carboxylate reductase [Candidatus Dadabacteria bacterium]|nr:pyrroline-5-carboxylate reductase [Candidatus Dadabacteria bacterium]NIS07813.1 pyrroline-5-carboxylate reductase [Candidatus Dadabacteria bacterium]NIV43033.1 pyrroline-5-carboxylate reductase [Candidatus Dadabacteria bacterium]NIY21431.1 pyrroline-5-carboxylate reductase [Candidatus Dadabacteria bacterium]